ncbi:MAG: Na+/H+ antiporter NhaA [Fimbriimonadaceae bacterium]|nr:Na+/H+ antiporter NhaA [Fimbriimonadaceae bacterium]
MLTDKAKREAAGRRLTRLRLLRPIVEFTHAQASSGIVLMSCAVIALILANSPWSHQFHAFWETPIGVSLGDQRIEHSLHHWINDGLMAIFFLLVGLEIKREILVGELSSARQAMFPIAAAIGGMVVPAGIFLALNYGKPTVQGWGIPMATDIAFSLGVLALLGSRAPLALKVFLTAFAIVDDLGAVLVIAIFYTAQINLAALALAGAALLVLMAMNALGVRKLYVYALVGLGLWAAMLASGIHATLAGVLLALTIPARTHLDSREFLKKGKELLAEFDDAGEVAQDVTLNEHRQGALRAIERACEEVQMPLQRMEHSLHGWVNLLIMPIFALANAGVSFGGLALSPEGLGLSLGVGLGLVVGKPIGIMLAAWASVKAGWAELPRGISWTQILGAGVLGGIGFTMSLFIGSLAFKDPQMLDAAKVGILGASFVAGLVGYLMLRRGRSRVLED